MKTFLKTLALLCLFGSVSKACDLRSACYVSDPVVTYAWSEGAKSLKDFAKKIHNAGTLYLYVRNEGKENVTLTKLTLNGAPMDTLHARHEVVWWRMLPRPLRPGRMAEIAIRLRNAPRDKTVLAASFSDGSTFRTSAPLTSNHMRIGSVGFSSSRDEVFLVATNPEGRSAKPDNGGTSRPYRRGPDIPHGGLTPGSKWAVEAEQ